MKKQDVENEDENIQNVEPLEEEKELKIDNSMEEQDENGPEEVPVTDEVQKLKDELAELKDKYIRLYSEFDNFKRRTAKERLDIINTAHSDLMEALIPVLDDFDRGQKSIDEKNTDLKVFKEGFDLIFDKFRKILTQKGLKEMECDEGSEFDAELHEAISQMPVEKKKLKGKVVAVVEKGYLMEKKVIRFAKVVVGS
ncbi:MAG: nucleotide exchange factor GrpE [Cyclobacteriaceae bacterium]|nr:nucleotide exchange factor GrpE [Cyclobacteriaceae bacterium]